MTETIYRIHGRPTHGLPFNIDPASIDLSQMQRDWERALRKLLGQWRDITDGQIAEIVDRVRSAVNADDVRSLITLSTSPAAAQAALIESMNEMAQTAAEQMARDLRAQGVHAEPQPGQPDRLAATAIALAALMATGLANAGARETLRRWGPAVSGDGVAVQIKRYLGNLSGTFTETSLGGVLSAAQNSGRFATMAAVPELALYANEVNDKNTCGPCRAVDGKWLGNASDMEMVHRLYPNGGYVDCEGGARCRGTVVGIIRLTQVSQAPVDILDRTYKRDKDGKFSSGGGAGAGGESEGGGDSSGRPGGGRDLTHDQAQMQSVYEGNVDANGQWRDHGNGDPALIDIAARQGFDAKPVVVSDAEFDRITAAGTHEVLYRGVQGTGETSASTIHTEVREGAYRPGYGIFGNGYYMAPDRSKAASFSDHTAGSLGRYALHSDAKTIDYDKLVDRYDREVFSSYKSQPRAVQAVTSDWGRYAAALGFDAIRVPAGTRMIGGAPVQRTEFVILNRGALIAAGGS